MARVHAFGDDALADDDAVGLRERLQAGTVSPRELVDAAIARAERVDPELGAVAYRAYDRARTDAAEQRPGWFSGIPTLVKDNADVAGLPTQQGSRAWVARPAARDGDVARVLGALGLVTLGKTQLSEFGFSASAEFAPDSGWPPVRNPWDPARTAGASSAGAAALVASGAVPLAHANDGGGSIRIPASCCGLVGLKPTRGRTPTEALNRQMPVRLVADGVLTRSVRDTAAFLRESERVYRELSLPPVGDIRGPSRKRLRVGVVTASIGERTVDAENVAAVESLGGLLDDAGHHVRATTVPAPETFADDFVLLWGFLAALICDTGRVSLGRHFDRRATDHLTQGLARHFHRHGWRFPAAVRRLRSSTAVSQRFWSDQRFDVVLSPVLAHPTPPLGVLDPGQPYETVLARLLEWVAFTPWQNATGEPAISLPTATSADGTPIGVMASAPTGGEATLLGLAFEVEQLAPFRRIQDR
ncbi:amidase [Nocardioides mangrovicus]|uniref:Amidase n=1 Tax=Nocardioides mangrovicus TaxID=2478913 RepID=A0A3L8P5V4_9ACTN|nr:amidase [Nocardioides mangrovicus]RLV50581.1 amidase [Nocardioides mangrovicus]